VVVKLKNGRVQVRKVSNAERFLPQILGPGSPESGKGQGAGPGPVAGPGPGAVAGWAGPGPEPGPGAVPGADADAEPGAEDGGCGDDECGGAGERLAGRRLNVNGREQPRLSRLSRMARVSEGTEGSGEDDDDERGGGAKHVNGPAEALAMMHHRHSPPRHTLAPHAIW